MVDLTRGEEVYVGRVMDMKVSMSGKGDAIYTVVRPGAVVGRSFRILRAMRRVSVLTSCVKSLSKRVHVMVRSAKRCRLPITRFLCRGNFFMYIRGTCVVQRFSHVVLRNTGASPLSTGGLTGCNLTC